MRADVLICHNPFDPFDRTAIELRKPRRIRALMPRSRPAIALLNGRPILRAGWRRRLRDGDRLAVVHLPRGGGGGGGSDPLRMLLSLALMAFAPWAAGALLGAAGISAGATLFGAFTVGQATALGIVLAGNALINALLPPPGSNTAPNPSPTYTLQAQGNMARLDQAIPVQYGRVLSYPDFAAQPYTEFAGNEQYLFQLLCLGVGEFDVEQLRIEDTPISAFSEIETQICAPGEQVTLFPTAVITSVEVAGQEIEGRVTATWSQSGTTITITEANHLRAVGQGVQLGFIPDGSGPSGVYQIASVTPESWTVTAPSGAGAGDVHIRAIVGGIDGFVASPPETRAHRLGIDLVLPRGLFTQSGAELGDLSLIVRAQAQRIDDLGQPIGVWFTLGEETITDRTNTPQRRTFFYDLATPGRYRVRVRRQDAKIDGNVGHEVLWTGLRAYLSETQDFGPVTLIAMRMRASNNLSAQSSRKVAVLATRKVPVWTGSGWSAPQPSRSIAWALADAARNAYYGAGLSDDRIDLPSLAVLDALWTARGDTFNGRFDSATTWWEGASRIAMAGRARIFMQGGRLRVVRDGPASVPVAMYSERNIVKGSFGIDFTMPDDQTADSVEVGIFDGTVWQPRRIKARLPGSSGLNPVKIDLFGVTDPDQALREGRYQAAANKLRRETIRFETEQEGFIPSIGDLISVQHSMPGYGQQAEAIAWNAATRALRLSEPLDWSGSNHHLVIRGRKGDPLGPWPVTRGSADNEVILPEDPPEPPYTGSDAERSHVAFGQAHKWSALCKVASVTPRGLFRVLIEAVVDHPDVHTAETGTAARALRYSQLPRRIVLPAVKGLLARTVPDDPDRVVLSWQPAPGADLYQIEMAEGVDLGDPNVSWTRVGDTTAATYLLTVMHPARTMVRVRALGLAPGPWAAAAVGQLVGLYYLAPSSTFWGADPDIHWRS